MAEVAAPAPMEAVPLPVAADPPADDGPEPIPEPLALAGAEVAAPVAAESPRLEAPVEEPTAQALEPDGWATADEPEDGESDEDADDRESEDEDAEDEDDSLVDSGDEDDGEADEEEAAAEAAAEADAAPRVTFADLGLSAPILQAVAEAGYVTPTPIQEAAIPIVLQGRDVLGCAQTGTGKTAGFTLPMLDILASGRAKARMPRSLILEPTRELALQVAENFVKYGKHLNLVHALLIGGESMNDQRAVLEKGVDVLIATPGRLLDLFDRGRILLADCKVLVIDEADRMLDMGFIPDVERIVSMLPPMRQTLFFSATMATEIRKLADAFLSNPKEISVSAPASVATTITAGLVWVREQDKREALRRLLRREAVQNALIFCNRKIEVDILYKSLKRHGFSVGALHGDMDQPARFATLNKFKANELQLLVCSDVAARGIDIGGLSHVFNFDVPFRDEDYVHRIGRTGRAGKQGAAFTIATADDARNVAAIEKLTGKPIPRIEIEGLDPVSNEEIAEAATRPGRGRGRGGPPGRGGRDAGRGRGERGGAERGGGERGGGERGGPRGGRDRRPEGDRPIRPESDRSIRPESDRPPRPERERDRGPDRRDRGPRPDRMPPSVARDDRPRDDRPRDDRPRDDRPRDDRPRDDRPRDDRPRDDRPRDDRPRDDRPRDDRPRDDRPRDDRRWDRDRDRSRRDRDDLGPAVRGFGEAVPAFMLIPIPRPRPMSAAEARAEADAEAA
jgi:superfamily II DNA/RNA helicase